MRRADTLLVVVVGAFAVFVGLRVAASPRPSRMVAKADSSSVARPSPAADASPVIRSSRSTSSSASARDVNVAGRGQIAPVPNPEQVRAFLAGATEGYLADMLAADSGLLVRWPDRREQGLRIWVQSVSSVRDWDMRYAQMARDGAPAFLPDSTSSWTRPALTSRSFGSIASHQSSGDASATPRDRTTGKAGSLRRL